MMISKENISLLTNNEPVHSNFNPSSSNSYLPSNDLSFCNLKVDRDLIPLIFIKGRVFSIAILSVKYNNGSIQSHVCKSFSMQNQFILLQLIARIELHFIYPSTAYPLSRKQNMAILQSNSRSKSTLFQVLFCKNSKQQAWCVFPILQWAAAN